MSDASGNLLLTEEDWEFIFNALQLSRTNFTKNPVLVDIMPEDNRKALVDKLSDIMDRIGYKGTIANQKGVMNNRCDVYQ